ncbi:MBL fold metallo-hydrolase [Paenibacillus sp. GP183]|uniref:MBL fold metallo-hydrolase n=1 Tax=Paenibacillus sp. GP183 TaxID=1882751 RepID=UPI00089A70CC|nr:MBL fold metallo-hydrolase [Paenibacillus sp. GP183]SEC79257.1 L-ascorbate metabolism protein UlaG, beta-lactamase superfamily [Paenibacillus sp. GP183]
MTIRIGEDLIREVDETRVPYGMLAIWFLGQVSVIIKGGDKVIYVDPYLSPSPHRAFEPPLKPEELTNADYVLITHDHSDHLDPDTIAVMAATQSETVYMAPGFCRETMLELGVQPDKLLWARTNEWRKGPGFRVKPIPSAHEELEYDPGLDHRFVGYVLELNGVTLYHAGDTTVYPGLIETLKAESIDLGMLPINGRDPFRNARNIVGNMNYREAAELAVAAGFDTVIPLHYDMFEANSERPGYFIDYLYSRHPMQKSHVLARFERYIYVSGSALKEDIR